MKEGPSESASRSRLQTTPSCCGKEPSVVSIGVKVRGPPRAGRDQKGKTPEPLLKRRDPETCRQNQRLLDPLGSVRRTPGYGADGDRRRGGASLIRALMGNCGTLSLRCQGRSPSGATTTRRAYQCGAQGRTNSYERGRPVMRPEQRGWAKRLSSTSNWQQEETLAATKPFDIPKDADRLLGGSGVSREAPAPFCERPEVKLLRPTRHESFNVLKTGGYHLEHNFGHRKEHLSALLACFNLLAFAIHTVCDLAEGACRKARTTLGPRVRFFQSLQALTSYLVFSSWTELLDTLAFARPPPSPSG